MATQIGVGFSQLTDSVEAVHQDAYSLLLETLDRQGDTPDA